MRSGPGVSQVAGVVLGALILEAVRRRLRADTWDYGPPATATGDPQVRGVQVVAVTFASDDFRTVSRGAAATGTEIAQYIRDAALARAYGSS